MKPGQIYVRNKKMYRVAKGGCGSCILNKPLLCPRAVQKAKDPPCLEYGYNFVSFS